jgi:hypothetical protein
VRGEPRSSLDLSPTFGDSGRDRSRAGRTFAQCKRDVFNGLARVIVQSTREAGEIRLTATSQALSPAVLRIASR